MLWRHIYLFNQIMEWARIIWMHEVYFVEMVDGSPFLSRVGHSLGYENRWTRNLRVRRPFNRVHWLHSSFHKLYRQKLTSPRMVGWGTLWPSLSLSLSEGWNADRRLSQHRPTTAEREIGPNMKRLHWSRWDTCRSHETALEWATREVSWQTIAKNRNLCTISKHKYIPFSFYFLHSIDCSLQLTLISDSKNQWLLWFL